MVFCTQDRDTKGCAASRGGPGWYGSDCAGYSMFLDDFQWPVAGVDVQPGLVYWDLVRLGPFYAGP